MNAGATRNCGMCGAQFSVTSVLSPNPSPGVILKVLDQVCVESTLRQAQTFNDSLKSLLCFGDTVF
jgi:hypothetical protein